MFAFKFVEKAQEIRGLANQAAALRYENKQTARQNAQYMKAIAYYKTMNYIKNEARIELGYRMPGETPVRTLPPVHPSYRSAPAVRSRIAAPAQPIWKQWWQVFFG